MNTLALDPGLTGVRETRNNAARQAGAPVLSVLIPTYRDDPRDLIAALARDGSHEVEVVIYEDGAPDPALSEALRAAALYAPVPVRVLTAQDNLGRSAARNRLGGAARGAWLLFLDADMRAGEGFLPRWLDILASCQADAVFGGYEPCEPRNASQTVHAALARASDVRSAVERNEIGAVAVCSSNLAVRRDFFARIPFDEGYAGWGWEDVDWALRAAEAGRVVHADNPARHGGLEDVERLIAKFAAAGPNFARLLERHPDYARQPGARLARTLKRWRLAAPARLAGAMTARTPLLPPRLRVLGLKLFRAGAAAGDLP
ncbi:glycosyltransferase family 2 protein [Alkalicaulis satelles]|uniref:Glycosyltransferase family 2 protein n=1 Tax=Alkalicaulis satelles TaxID=2609175 RepID=A0A5M6ZLT9_9PROT|nr:glycosyltransferase [Alkalicaulis satelles]KAA5804704.1 glycosyltransferase family 2 protein [Alkalicaulis satelles]